MTHILTLPNGDIIREGEYGVTRDGQKVGPIAVRWPTDPEGDFWGIPDSGRLINSNGRCWGQDRDRDIVAKWVAEPAAEIGTLAELKVQVGDVVVMVDDDDCEHLTIKECPPRNKHFADHWQMQDGELCRDEKFEIISRATTPLPYGHVKLVDGSIWDMTAERQYPFGMLTDEQHAALQAHGGPYQSHSGDQWLYTSMVYKSDYNSAYRVTPKPTRETVVNRDMYLAPNGTIDYAAYCGRKPVTVTYDTIDGVIDYETYKVEAR